MTQICRLQVNHISPSNTRNYCLRDKGRTELTGLAGSAGPAGPDRPSWLCRTPIAEEKLFFLKSGRFPCGNTTQAKNTNVTLLSWYDKVI